MPVKKPCVFPSSNIRRREPGPALSPILAGVCPGTRRLELAACAGVVLGICIGLEGPDFPNLPGVDMDAWGIVAAWTITGGALLTLGLNRARGFASTRPGPTG